MYVTKNNRSGIAMKLVTALAILVFGSSLEANGQWTNGKWKDGSFIDPYSYTDESTGAQYWTAQSESSPLSEIRYECSLLGDDELNEVVSFWFNDAPQFSIPPESTGDGYSIYKQEIKWDKGRLSDIRYRQHQDDALLYLHSPGPDEMLSRMSSHSKISIPLALYYNQKPESAVYVYELDGAKEAIQYARDNCLKGEPPSKPTVKKEEEVGFFLVPEEMPELVGGFGSILANMRYPQRALDRGIYGRVFVEFTVDEHGDILDAKVRRSVDTDLDREALRIVRKVRFTPGRHNGEAVKVRMSVPISFNPRR